MQKLFRTITHPELNARLWTDKPELIQIQYFKSKPDRKFKNPESWCNGLPPDFLNFTKVIFQSYSSKSSDVIIINDKSCTCLSRQGLIRCVTVCHSNVLSSLRGPRSICGTQLQTEDVAWQEVASSQTIRQTYCGVKRCLPPYWFQNYNYFAKMSGQTFSTDSLKSSETLHCTCCCWGWPNQLLGLWGKHRLK